MHLKRTLIKLSFLIILSIFTTLGLSATEPILLFSDITSGPKNGWSYEQADKGVAVSIWGSGFGDIRTSSFVSVNGTALHNDTDYAVWGTHWPTEHFQRITFWLNDSMNDGEAEITVTVDGVESNPLPFTIRAGAIYFINRSNIGGDGSLANPFDVENSNYNWIDNMQPGDVYYFRDSEVYEGEFNGGNSVIWIRNSEPSGTAALPIAFLGYPGERPIVSVPTYDVNHSNGISFSNNHMVMSGFQIDSEWRAANMGGDFNRFVGNDVIGLKNLYGSGTGIITSGNSTAHTGDGNQFLGNTIHGGNSQNRFDHGIYLSGCADNGGAEVGWNHFYDNDFGRGPIISINHQDNRCDDGQVLDAHFIFNNIVDCSKQRSRAVGVFDLSFDGEEEAPEPTYVYNNLIISCGTFDGENLNHVGYSPAMSQSARGAAHFYNNTLYDAGYIGFRIKENATESSIKNNIIHMTGEVPGPTGNHYVRIDNESIASLANNLYFGIGDYSPCTDCAMDQDHINNLDPLFVDASNLNFQLQAGSPAIGAGNSNLYFEIPPPDYAPIDRDLNFIWRNIVPSLGAFEGLSTTQSRDLNIELTGVTVFPNPAINSFILQFDLSTSTTIGISVHDMLGKRVKEINFQSYPAGNHQVLFETDDFASGMFFIQIHNPDAEEFVKKVVIK